MLKRVWTSGRSWLVPAFVVASVAVGAVWPGSKTAAADPSFGASWVDQSAYPTVAPGGTAELTVRFQNAGTATWRRGVYGAQVNLGIQFDSILFSDLGMAVGWLSANRVATTQEDVVVPGAVATFSFSVRAPSSPGVYRLPLQPVADGVTWLDDYGVYLDVTSAMGFHSKWVSQSAYPTVAPGLTAPVTIAFRNVGPAEWVRGRPLAQANLGVKGDDESWGLLGIGWLSANRVATTNESRVSVGDVGSFTFALQAPATPGTYRLQLRPVIDGVMWMEDEGVYIDIIVTAGWPPAGMVARIAVSPESATISASAWQTYTARAFDAPNNDLGDVTAQTAFAIAPEGSCAGSSCTASMPGEHTVTGTHTPSGNSATATLTVVTAGWPPAAMVARIAVSPESATISASAWQTYTARAFDAPNNDLGDVTAQTTFVIAPDGGCAGSSCTASMPGEHTVTGTYTPSGNSATVTLTVVASDFD